MPPQNYASSEFSPHHPYNPPMPINYNMNIQQGQAHPQQIQQFIQAQLQQIHKEILECDQATAALCAQANQQPQYQSQIGMRVEQIRARRYQLCIRLREIQHQQQMHMSTMGYPNAPAQYRDAMQHQQTSQHDSVIQPSNYGAPPLQLQQQHQNQYPQGQMQQMPVQQQQQMLPPNASNYPHHNKFQSAGQTPYAQQIVPHQGPMQMYQQHPSSVERLPPDNDMMASVSIPSSSVSVMQTSSSKVQVRFNVLRNKKMYIIYCVQVKIAAPDTPGQTYISVVHTPNPPTSSNRAPPPYDAPPPYAVAPSHQIHRPAPAIDPIPPEPLPPKYPCSRSMGPNNVEIARPKASKKECSVSYHLLPAGGLSTHYIQSIVLPERVTTYSTSCTLEACRTPSPVQLPLQEIPEIEPTQEAPADEVRFYLR
jgi:hypothetical protein